MRPRRSFERPQQGSLGERRERLLLARLLTDCPLLPVLTHCGPVGLAIAAIAVRGSGQSRFGCHGCIRRGSWGRSWGGSVAIAA